MAGTDCILPYVFYNCVDNGFKGCCSDPAACDPDMNGCPEDAIQPDDYSPMSTTTVRTFDGVSSVMMTTSTSATRTFAASSTTSGTLSPSSATAPVTQNSETLTQSLPPPLATADQDPSDTSQGDDSSSLSMAAIAGISVGGTVFALFVLLIAALRIRRYRIAKRHASHSRMSAANFPGEEAQLQVAYAREFWKEHRYPCRRPSVDGRAELG